nr:condensin-2 complex subunit H2 [Zootoca vivipara]
MEDVESRFVHFLKPIRDLTANWAVDVAAQLEEYLEELAEICISFDNGRTTMNFAEAAMLIQGSACIYSKKVEYLYSLVYQALDFISNKRREKQVASVGEDGVDRDVSNGPAEAEEEFLSLDDIQDTSRASKDLRGNQRHNAVSVVPLTPMALVPPEDAEKKNNPLFSRKGEKLASRKDFHMNTCTPQATGIFMLELAGLSPIQGRNMDRGIGSIGAQGLPPAGSTPMEVCGSRTPVAVLNFSGESAGAAAPMCDDNDDCDNFLPALPEEFLGGSPARVEEDHVEHQMSIPQRRGYMLRERGPAPDACVKEMLDPWRSLDPFTSSEDKPLRKGSGVERAACQAAISAKEALVGVHVSLHALGDLRLRLVPVVIVQEEPVWAEQVDDHGVVHNVVAVLVSGAGAGVDPEGPAHFPHLLRGARQPQEARVEIPDVLGHRQHVVPLGVDRDEDGLDSCLGRWDSPSSSSTTRLIFSSSSGQMSGQYSQPARMPPPKRTVMSSRVLNRRRGLDEGLCGVPWEKDLQPAACHCVLLGCKAPLAPRQVPWAAESEAPFSKAFSRDACRPVPPTKDASRLCQAGWEWHLASYVAGCTERQQLVPGPPANFAAKQELVPAQCASFCETPDSSSKHHRDVNERSRKKGPVFPDLEVLYWKHAKERLAARNKLNRMRMVSRETRRAACSFIHLLLLNFAAPDFLPVQTRQFANLMKRNLIGTRLARHTTWDPPPTPVYLGGVPPALNYEEYIQRNVELFMSHSQKYARETALSRHVRDWEEMVVPKLEEQESHEALDIHHYGDMLASKLGAVGEWHSFASLVAGQPPFEVCRYLLASLQLANDYTVEISQKPGLEEGVDTMALRLLTKEKAHERFRNYTAPSLDQH